MEEDINKDFTEEEKTEKLKEILEDEELPVEDSFDDVETV